MKHVLVALLLATITIPALPTPADAGTLNRACLKSDRSGASRRMCRCMQQVADRELLRGDQRLAASFFEDPHRAQEIRQSDRLSHERFWKRYKEFSATFAATCGHLN